MVLNQASSTAAALSALTAPSEVPDLDAHVHQVTDRFRKLAKRVRNRSIDLEDAVANSIDVRIVFWIAIIITPLLYITDLIFFQINDRLNILNEALNETRDLAATIGVRLDPPSHDSAPDMPPDFDASSMGPSTYIQQPVSMRSEYLSGQIAEGKAILDTLERRLPALKELMSVIEERLEAQAQRKSETSRRPLSIEEDDFQPLDASGE